MIKLEFEGTDGAGKTTGLKYFIERARERGLNVVETREVGNPHIPSCVKLREFVLEPANNLRGDSMEFIFAAMRMENDRWYENLLNSENPPDLVVSDRGWVSHLAYTDHNVSPEFTLEFYENVVSERTSKPDVVIYFAVNTETALIRRNARNGGVMDVIEAKGIEYQENVRHSFRYHLANADFLVYDVDGNQSIQNVQEQLDAILEDIIAL